MKKLIQKIVPPNAASLVSAFVLLALFVFSFLFGSRIAPNATADTFLFNLLQQFWLPYPLLSFIAGLVIVAVVAFLLFQNNEKFSFIRVRTMLPSLFFLLLLLCSRFEFENSSGLIGCLFLILSCWILISCYQEREAVGSIFNAFFFLSIGSFFSFDLLLLIPVCWISFFFLRIASLRAWLASLIGLIAPYLIYIPILFISENLPAFMDSFLKQWEFSFAFSAHRPVELAYKIFLAVLFLVSFINFQTHINADRVKTRQILYFLYLLAFTILVISTLKNNSFVNIFPMVALTLSILLGHYFSLKSSIASTIFFIVIIITFGVFYFII